MISTFDKFSQKLTYLRFQTRNELPNDFKGGKVIYPCLKRLEMPFYTGIGDKAATHVLKTRFLPKFPNVEMLQLIGGKNSTEKIKIEKYRTVCPKLKTVSATDDEKPQRIQMRRRHAASPPTKRRRKL